MFYLKTETVDVLSVPFGIVIGPCTILSNVIKSVGDVAKAAFYGMLSIGYVRSEAYDNFRAADLAWEQNISPKYKPQHYLNYDGGFTVRVGHFSDPESSRVLLDALGTPVARDWTNTYFSLSAEDRRQVAFEQAKQDFLQHLTFIGIGIIRSIPLVGGTARCIYNAIRAG